LSYASLSPPIIRFRVAFETCVAKRIPFLKQNRFGVNVFFAASKINSKQPWKELRQQMGRAAPENNKPILYPALPPAQGK